MDHEQRPLGWVLAPVEAGRFQVALNPELQNLFLEGHPVFLRVGDTVVVGSLQRQAIGSAHMADPVFRSAMFHEPTRRYLVSALSLESTATFFPSAYYVWREGRYQPSIPDRLPVPGQPVYLFTKERAEELFPDHPVLGEYMTGVEEGVPVPVDARHFGPMDQGGLGEGFTATVFGPAGSGKTVLALKLALLFARNPEMGLFLVDPHEEMAKDTVGSGTRYPFPLHGALRAVTEGRFDPKRDVFTLDSVGLEGSGLFANFLALTRFYGLLGVGKNKVVEAIEALGDTLRKFRDKRKEYKLSAKLSLLRRENPDLYRELTEEVLGGIASSYAASNREQQQGKFRESWTQHEEALVEMWDTVAERFDLGRRPPLKEILRDVLRRGRKVIFSLNLAEENPVQARLRGAVLGYVFTLIEVIARTEGGDNNALVLVDEAPAFVPRKGGEEGEEELAERLVAMVRQFRKFRVGFVFVSQSIYAVHPAIFSEASVRVYAAGLSDNRDLEAIANKEGPEGLKLYEALPKPWSLNRRYYLGAGRIFPLTAGKPFAFTPHDVKTLVAFLRRDRELSPLPHPRP